MYVADYSMSLAVWVALIALVSLDAETGMVTLIHPVIFLVGKQFEVRRNRHRATTIEP